MKKELIKLANHLDQKGYYKEADDIDKILKKSSRTSSMMVRAINSEVKFETFMDLPMMGKTIYSIPEFSITFEIPEGEVFDPNEFSKDLNSYVLKEIYKSSIEHAIKDLEVDESSLNDMGRINAAVYGLKINSFDLIDENGKKIENAHKKGPLGMFGDKYGQVKTVVVHGGQEGMSVHVPFERKRKR